MHCGGCDYKQTTSRGKYEGSNVWGILTAVSYKSVQTEICALNTFNEA